MSIDPFETRLQFLRLLRSLNASQQSIQTVVRFAVKYGSRCGEDLWECILEESAKGTLNTRINILYFLDSLAEVSITIGPPDAPYLGHISKHLRNVVNNVVPDTREGVLNLRSAKQILESWRMRRVIEPSIIDEIVSELENRGPLDEAEPQKRDHNEAFSKTDILRRMEEDRERHKRLRERIWILPIPPLQAHTHSSLASRPSNPSNPSPQSPFTPASPSTQPNRQSALVGQGKMLPPPRPNESIATSGLTSGGKSGNGETALEVEFDQAWETVAELDDDDVQRMKDEMLLAQLPLPTSLTTGI